MANILLGITGGIAAYKACDVISGLLATGHKVKTIMTENATKFITPLTIESVSGGEVHTSMWERRTSIKHIELATWADVFLVYPATVNIMAKFANGIADDLLSTTFMALPLDKCRIVICPACNTRMYEHPINVKNMRTLLFAFTDILNHIHRPVIHFIEPVVGRLACGDVGKGKAEEPRKVVEFVNKLLEDEDAALEIPS